MDRVQTNLGRRKKKEKKSPSRTKPGRAPTLVSWCWNSRIEEGTEQMCTKRNKEFNYMGGMAERIQGPK
jgi:hypothetical protein